MQIATYTLRPFKPADLQPVNDINQKCLPENYTAFFFLDLHERFPKTFIVAEENGRIVGYIMCRIETGMSTLQFLGVTKKGHVISIAVMHGNRQHGVGRALLQEAVRAMLLYGAKECYLEVRKGNTAAVNLYKQMGFRITRTMHSYYADGEDAYQMARKLPLEETPDS